MNCAWHIRQLGADVAMVSAVGNDDLGMASLATLNTSGIDCTHVAIRPESTGIVDIMLTNGQPDYTIRENVAWDCIPRPKADFSGELLYFGTLAQRTQKNRATLNALISQPFTHRFFDINLRQEYYSREIICAGLSHATVVKLNEEERASVCSMLQIDDQRELIERFNLHALIVTLGELGAELFTPDQHVTSRAAPVVLVDAVGAGDAFSAVMCVALMNQTSLSEALQKACDVGAYVVQHRGAQVELPQQFSFAS